MHANKRGAHVVAALTSITFTVLTRIHVTTEPIH